MKNVKLDGRETRVSTIFCIGRNYAAHAAELGNAIEEEPLVFLKPLSSLLPEGEPIVLPSWSQDIHHECELVLLIGKGGRNIPERDALAHVAGFGIGLDLTARDVQTELKKKGHPWTRAKGFPGAACVSAFVSPSNGRLPEVFRFSLAVNGEVRQRGDTSLMLFPIARLVSHLSSLYGLQEGDLVYTGTPEGVGPLQGGDRLSLTLDGHPGAQWSVA
ncbi:fumarylacetoacetate hydrolase family protein [Paludibacterium paludis]|uniref:Isomerase n=1 Tax=Paludibacterium paludis TaxID=1225769 RepID=A0A918NZD6_9NEIS|nr:fumarylacetoacetate hydrolase family protein [Paludibacterium paludis]GGY06859.1 isomerase [Paludibacterium paludis]